MRHEDCIFEKEEDCLKESIGITCNDCKEYRHHETIEKAIRDFGSLGESFEEVFTVFQKLLNNDGELVEIKTPAEHFLVVNRVMNSLLSTNENLTISRIMYRRLIFHLFGFLIDEFKETEYEENIQKH